MKYKRNQKGAGTRKKTTEPRHSGAAWASINFPPGGVGYHEFRKFVTRVPGSLETSPGGIVAAAAAAAVAVAAAAVKAKSKAGGLCPPVADETCRRWLAGN